jgi:small subunit ribosomal protein S3
MGHKVHPTGFRIGVIKGWQAKWYADRHYAHYLAEDLKIRQAIETKYPDAAISLVEIERQSNQVVATIHTARPGIVIGRGGQRVDEARATLEKLLGKRIQLNIKEVQQPELDARLVARSIADQIERRIAYRRAMKQAMTRTMQAGGKGIKLAVAGRLGGAEIARRLNMHEGRVPLHTLRADIDYGFTEARTVMGRIGVKAWIYKGEILPEAKVKEAEAPVAKPVVVAETAPPAPSLEVKPVAVPTPVQEKAAPAPVAAAPAPVEAAPAPVAEAAPAAEAEKKAARPRTRTTRKVAPTPATEAPPPAAEAEKKPARPRTRTTRKVTPKTATPGEETASGGPVEPGEDHATT